MLACLVFLAGLMFLVPSHIAEASNWVWVTSTDYATVTVDSSSVHRYQGTIYYWDRWEFIDSPQRNAFIEYLTQARRNVGDDQTDFSDFWMMQCRLHAYQAQSGTIYSKDIGITYYDSGGNVIYSFTVPESMVEWGLVAPDTIGEAIFKVARSYAR